MYLTIFPAAIEIKKRSVESVARPRYIPPPPPPSPSSSSWEEGSTTVDNSPKSWDAPVDGLLTYVLTGTSIAPISHFAEPGAKKLKDKKIVFGESGKYRKLETTVRISRA